MTDRPGLQPPPYPAPPPKRLLAALDELSRVEACIAPGSHVKLTLLIRAGAVHVPVGDVMWAIYCQVQAGRYQSHLANDCRIEPLYWEHPELAPAGLELADRCLHCDDGTATPWAVWSTIMPPADVPLYIPPELETPAPPAADLVQSGNKIKTEADEVLRRFGALTDSVQRQIAVIATEKKLVLNDKLRKISDLDPSYLVATSQKLGDLCGRTRQAVEKIAWWKYDRILRLKAIAAGQESAYGVSADRANEYLATCKSTRNDID